MKRILAVLISVAISCTLLLCGCGTVDRNEELKDVQSTALDNLNTSFSEDTCDYSLVNEFLKSWAKSCDIKLIASGPHYTVLENPATDDSSNKLTILHCGVRTDDVKSSLDTLATALACLLGPEKHQGIRLIVTENSEGQFIGAEKLPSEFLNCDNFISLNRSEDFRVYMAGAYTSSATLTSARKTKNPSYGNAYEIMLKTSKYADPYKFEKKNNYPNPITTLGNFLATAKSSGKLFDVASFTSKCKDGYMPYEAKAIIVIDDNGVEALLNKFDKSYESVKKKFDNVDDDFVYSMTETALPDKVLSDSSANNLISLMYTLNSGICEQDEESGLIYSASCIESADTANKLEVKVDMRSRGHEYLNTLSSEYKTLAGLCNANYSANTAYASWSVNSGSELQSYFGSHVPLAAGESDIMLNTSELNIFSKKYKNLNAVSFTFNKDSKKNVLRDITNFLNTEKNKLI